MGNNEKKCLWKHSERPPFSILARVLLMSFHLEILKTLVHSLAVSLYVRACQEQRLQGFTHYSPFLSFQLEHRSMLLRRMRFGRLGAWSVGFGRRWSLSSLSPQIGILVCLLIICDMPKSQEGNKYTDTFLLYSIQREVSLTSQINMIKAAQEFLLMLFLQQSSVFSRLISSLRPV